MMNHLIYDVLYANTGKYVLAFYAVSLPIMATFTLAVIIWDHITRND